MKVRNQVRLPWRRLVALLMLGLLIALAGGCSGTGGNTPPPPAGNAGSHEIVDATGTVLKLEHKPQRIASLSISTDEILMALVAPERIAALSYLVDDPGISNIAGQTQAVAGRVKANAEVIIAFQPDLVITPDWQPATLIQTLREAGIIVYVYKAPANLAEVKQAVAAIARGVGEEAAGARVIDGMDKALAQIDEVVSQIPADKRQVVIRSTLLGDSGGIGSTFEDICRYAGVQDGAAMLGLSMNEMMSKEQIVKINPDIIFLPLWDYAGKTDLQKFGEDMQHDPALQPVKAIQNRRLVAVPDSHLSCNSQYIVEAVRDVARAAYPEYFKDR